MRPLSTIDSGLYSTSDSEQEQDKAMQHTEGSYNYIDRAGRATIFLNLRDNKTQQRNRASVIRKNPKNVTAMVSEWSSRTQYTVDILQ